jgi:hypothetical protein
VVTINSAQISNLEQAGRAADGRYEGCIDCECDCPKNKGRWERIPFLRSFPSFTIPTPTGLSTLYAYDSIPVGVKIHLSTEITATIGGTLECKCADKPNCKVTTDVNFNLTVPVTVPLPIDGWGLALRAVPYAGQAYGVAKLAYQAGKMSEALGNVSWAFEPALRVVRESADLICEGRFDPQTLVRHVLDIGSTIRL